MRLRTQKQAWKNLSQKDSWEKFTSPSRPSRDDIRNYNRMIQISLKNKMNPEILVLGSTPEIRDMLVKFSLLQKAKITCLDMSEDMYRAMSGLLKNDNMSNETFVLGNWINTKLDKKFDIILGDYVVDNIDHASREEFLKNISGLLKKDGAFIIRDYVLTKKYKSISMQDIFTSYASQVKNEKITIKEAANWIWNDLLWDSYFKNDKGLVSLGFLESEVLDFGRKIKSSVKKNPLLEGIYDYFLLYFELLKSKYWTTTTKEKEEKLLKKFFKIKEIAHSKDYSLRVTDSSPLYRLEKK